MAETITYYRGPWRWVDDGVWPYWSPPDGCAGSLDLRAHQEMESPGKFDGEMSGVGLFAIRGVAKIGLEYDLLGSGAAHDVKASRKLRDAIPARRRFQVQGDDLLSLARSLLMDGSDPTGQEFAKPLIPGADGKIRFHLGPLCRHMELKASSLKATYWSNVRDLIRADFARVFADAKSGRLRDPQQHRRVLDATCEKYGMQNWQELVPKSLIKDVEGRLPHATTYTDNFNRASLGAGWSTTRLAGLAINASKELTSGGVGFGAGRYDSDLSSDDHYCQMNATARVSVIAISTRLPSSGESAYTYTERGSTSPTRRLFKRVGTTDTVIAFDSAAPASLPHTIQSRSDGSTISAREAGVEILTTTDTAITGNLRCGAQFSASSDRGDDWIAEDLAAAPGIIYTQLEKGIRGLNRGTYTQPGAG